MFKKISGVIFLGVFFSFLFDVATSPAISQNRQFHVKSHLQFDKSFSGKTFVLDGDSIKVGVNEVRLVEIDAPEYSQKCFDEKKQEYACGQISRDFLIKLAGGKEVKCFYAQKDKYDRFLGKCWVGEISINQEILKNGMAVIYNFAEVDEKMVGFESDAKTKKIGIWRGAFQLPKDYRKEHPRK